MIVTLPLEMVSRDVPSSVVDQLVHWWVGVGSAVCESLRGRESRKEGDEEELISQLNG